MFWYSYETEITIFSGQEIGCLRWQQRWCFHSGTICSSIFICLLGKTSNFKPIKNFEKILSGQFFEPSQKSLIKYINLLGYLSLLAILISSYKHYYDVPIRPFNKPDKVNVLKFSWNKKIKVITQWIGM
jgi:hypothetical protein